MKAKANNLPDYVTQGEAATAAHLVNDLVAAGYIVSVDNGGDDDELAITFSDDPAAIARALAQTGMDTLIVYDRTRQTEFPESGRNAAPRAGSILLVWGNDPQGEELVSDWSWNDTTESGLAFNAWMDAWKGWAE